MNFIPRTTVEVFLPTGANLYRKRYVRKWLFFKWTIGYVPQQIGLYYKDFDRIVWGKDGYEIVDKITAQKLQRYAEDGRFSVC